MSDTPFEHVSFEDKLASELTSKSTLPHSIEAEQSVLGGLMLDNDAWERVLDQVSDGDFYRHDHRLIFRAIAKFADHNQPFDVVPLAEMLDKEGQTAQTGGLAYLGELAKNTPSVANLSATAALRAAGSELNLRGRMCLTVTPSSAVSRSAR